MPSEHDQGTDSRYTALYIGVVVDVADPKRLGRIRVNVPGLIEPASAWAFPLGTVGGGIRQRGGYAVPPLGAEVGIFFHQGDVDAPYYLAGHWGEPQGQRETPGPVGLDDVAPEEAPSVYAYETKTYMVVIDEREGKERLYLRDKSSHDMIELDGVNKRINISATTELNLKASGRINIDGLAVTINGRPVLPKASDI